MTALRTLAIIFIFICTALAWAILGGTVMKRTNDAKNATADAVGNLWGTEHRQRAPVFSYAVTREVLVQPEAKETETPVAEGAPNAGAPAPRDVTPAEGKAKKKLVEEYVYVEPTNTDVAAKLKLDYRRKGLLWFSTYVVDFRAHYRIVNDTDQPHNYNIAYSFPATNALYDNFVFRVNGQEIKFPGVISQGITTAVTLAPGEAADVVIGYKSPGLDRWVYAFGDGVARVRNFSLVADTDFRTIDFPTGCISPTAKAKTGAGWQLTWKYTDLLTGYAVGVEMPKKLNPGPIASRMSFFAPVSLLFFFTVLFIISAVKADAIKPLHPMNYFFLGAAFFAFHLLYAYLADHTDAHITFAIAGLVSCVLVFIYVALARGAKYALTYGTLPQLAFLILFSYAFFFQGYTGLIITVGSILTLAVLMFATARVDWANKFGPKKSP